MIAQGIGGVEMQIRGRQAPARAGSTNRRRLRSVRGLPRVVWVLAAGSFINRFGGFVLVFLVLYVRHLGYSPVGAGLAASAYAAGKLVAGPAGGELADRLGPRPCIAFSMFGSATAMLMLSQLRWLPGLLTLAWLTGLLGELYRPSTSKLIADAVGGSQRITAFGVYQTGVSAGTAAGPAIAGLLAERSYQWLFVGDAATSALWGLLALIMLPTPRPSSALAEDQPAAAATASKTRRRAARLLAATVLVNVVLFQSQSTFPLWVTSHGHSPVIYGSLLSASALLTVALQLPLSNLVRRSHPPLVIAASNVVVGAGFGLLGFGGTLAVLLAATLVWTLGELIQWPVAASYLTDLAPPRQLGRYAGVRSLTYGTAMLIAPAAGTAIYHHYPRLIWWLSLTAALAAGAVLLPDLRRPTTPALPSAGTTISGPVGASPAIPRVASAGAWTRPASGPVDRQQHQSRRAADEPMRPRQRGAAHHEGDSCAARSRRAGDARAPPRGHQLQTRPPPKGLGMATEPLSRSSAALLLVDHQTRVLEWVVKVPPRDLVEANVLRLARAAAALDMPVIFTTSEESENGALLPALEQLTPTAYQSRIERHGLIDSLADPAVKDALAATGKSQLITAGIGTEVCGIPAALHAHRDGYQVTFVADACGSPTAMGQEVSLRRLQQEGITVSTTASVLAELAGDYPSYSRIMRGS